MRGFQAGLILFKSTAQLKATFTVVFSTGVYTSAAHGWSDGDLVQVSNSGGALPSGLVASTNYYIINSTTNTFALSATKGGKAVTLTDNGTGTNSVNLKGHMIMVPDFRHVMVDINTAGSANFTMKFQSSNQEALPDFNAAISPTNAWNYSQIVDLATGTKYAGAMGLAPAGADVNYRIEYNEDGIRFCNIEISGWSAGTLSAVASTFNDND